MLKDTNLSDYERLNALGQQAKGIGDHEQALDLFNKAELLARTNNDPLKTIHALTPAARALWSLGLYDDATSKLRVAYEIAQREQYIDEQGITISNLGRIAAVEVVATVPINEQKTALKARAVPNFRQARSMLEHNPHLYYRYANAQHGSVIAALAGDRRLAAQLVFEGMRVAFRSSEEPYDTLPTYKINKLGLLQMVAATLLIPLAEHTPLLAKMSRRKLIR